MANVAEIFQSLQVQLDDSVDFKKMQNECLLAKSVPIQPKTDICQEVGIVWQKFAKFGN